MHLGIDLARLSSLIGLRIGEATASVLAASEMVWLGEGRGEGLVRVASPRFASAMRGLWISFPHVFLPDPILSDSTRFIIAAISSIRQAGLGSVPRDAVADA
jgi:hypothetical protein